MDGWMDRLPDVSDTDKRTASGRGHLLRNNEYVPSKTVVREPVVSDDVFAVGQRSRFILPVLSTKVIS